MSGAQPLRLVLTSSPPLAALIGAVHGAAALCLLAVFPGWAGKALAALALLLGAAAALDRALLKGARAPSRIELYPDGSARVVFSDGSTAAASAAGGIGVTRWWVALQLAQASRRGLLVPAGMLAPEPMRQLRLWALWGRLPLVPASAAAADVAAPQLPA